MKKTLTSLYIILPLTVILLFGLAYSVLILHSVPDYDELAYVVVIQKITNFLSNFTYYGFDSSLSNLPLVKTNMLNSYVLSVVELIIPHSFAVFLLHTFYLFFLIFILQKFFDKKFIALTIIILAGNFYFMNLYGTFVSEYSVGILLICITVLSFFDHNSNNSKWLSFTLVLFLLTRVINLIFVAGFLGILLLFYFLFENKEYIKNVFKSYFYALVIASPFFLPIIPFYIDRIYNRVLKQTGVSENWRAMSGIESKLDIPLYIFNTTTHYNSYLLISSFILSIIFLFSFRQNKQKIKEFLAIFLTLLMVLFAFSNANSSHPLLVFWFYSILSLLTVFVLFNLIKNYKIIYNSIYILTLAYLIYISFHNYSQNYLYHSNKDDVYQISKTLAKELNSISNELVFTNYGGIGSLDLAGINLNTRHKKTGFRVDKMSFDKNESYFIDELKNADILLLANKNFLWQDYSKFININRYTNKIYDYVNKNFKELGFFRYKKVYYSNDKERYFEIFTKPYAELILPYEHYKGDRWLGVNNVIRLFPNNMDFSNKQLVLDVEVPCIEGNKPPFNANLLTEHDKVIDIYYSEHCGDNKVVFDLNDYNSTSKLFFTSENVFKTQPASFKYIDWITEPFSRKGTPDRVDTRKLTYYYRSSSIVDKHIKKVKGFYSDGWVEQEALIRAYKHNKQQTIYGVVPVEALSLLPISISIKSKDIDVVYKVTQVGDFKINIPEIKEDQEMKITTDKSFDLPSPDTRNISWRLIKWEK